MKINFDTENSANVQAALDYCAKERPDWLGTLRKMVGLARSGSKEGDGFLFLVMLGFEAGRDFQKDNPTVPLGGGSHYLGS